MSRLVPHAETNSEDTAKCLYLTKPDQALANIALETFTPTVGCRAMVYNVMNKEAEIVSSAHLQCHSFGHTSNSRHTQTSENGQYKQLYGQSNNISFYVKNFLGIVFDPCCENISIKLRKWKMFFEGFSAPIGA